VQPKLVNVGYSGR